MPPAPAPTPRPTARVLVVDEDDRLLLFCFSGQRSGTTQWWTLGGGAEPGESYEQAAVRELREETGLVGVTLSAEVWRGTPWVALWDDSRYEIEQRYFMVRVPHFDIDTSGFEDREKTSVRGHRWWTIEELAATTQILRPAELPRLFARLLADGPPSEPIIVDE